MEVNTYRTPKGTIHHWTNRPARPKEATLVFLPGLTADHRLFDPQVSAFEDRCPLLVQDAPDYAASWPFELDFRLEDKAGLKGSSRRKADGDPAALDWRRRPQFNHG